MINWMRLRYLYLAFSLLIIIFAEDFTPIPLGYGFTLNGIGGLLGVNRTVVVDVLRAGIKNQLFSYFCQIYPNTEMNDPAYREKFKIRTVTLPLCEIHGAMRPEGSTPESRSQRILSPQSRTP